MTVATKANRKTRPKMFTSAEIDEKIGQPMTPEDRERCEELSEYYGWDKETLSERRNRQRSAVTSITNIMNGYPTSTIKDLVRRLNAIIDARE